MSFKFVKEYLESIVNAPPSPAKVKAGSFNSAKTGQVETPSAGGVVEPESMTQACYEKTPPVFLKQYHSRINPPRDSWRDSKRRILKVDHNSSNSSEDEGAEVLPIKRNLTPGPMQVF